MKFLTRRILENLRVISVLDMSGIQQQEQATVTIYSRLCLIILKETLMLAHNGNLVNAPELRKELARTGAIFQTTIDTEVIAYIIARERINTKSAEEAVVAAMKKVSGAYSLVISSPRKLIGARDPFGSDLYVSESVIMHIYLHPRHAH